MEAARTESPLSAWTVALQRIAAASAPIAAKELPRNLRELEYAGLVTRRQQSDIPDGQYALTELGRTLEQTFRALGEFGTAYLRSRRLMLTKPE